LKERLASAVVERERQSAAINELRQEVDRAAVTIESLRRELKQTESTDEERLRAQRARIDGLTVDLSEALDTAARRERELEEARRQIEAGRGELATLRDEYERLVLMGGSGMSAAGISDEERREMVDNINNAIGLIDKYLVDG
jgi:chromosome segregation ATPase